MREPYSKRGARHAVWLGWIGLVAILLWSSWSRCVHLPRQHRIERAIARAVRGVLDLWVDQFVTGRFNPMEVRGLGRNKDYMQVTVVPEMLANLPPYQVQLVAQLPQDDISRLQAAQAARQGGRSGC